MRKEKLKELLKNKKVQSIAAVTICGALIAGLGIYILTKDNINKNTVTNKKVTVEDKVNDEEGEKAAKKQLEELKKIDISKLSDEDKKATEEQIKAIEDIINKKEYSKVETEVANVKKSIDNKINEIAKEEEIAKQEESKKVEENKSEEVASSSTENSTSNSSSDNTTSSNTTSNEAASTSNQEVVKETKKEAPPVVEEKPAPVVEQPTTPVTPPPAPVEEQKPTYPTVAEVQQRLIAYGQSLGLTYDPSVVSEGWNFGGTQQMWDTRTGGAVDGQRLFNGFDKKRFAIVVNDLGQYCDMQIYASWE